MAINYWHEYDYDRCYHVYNRSNACKNLFYVKEDFTFFMRKYNMYFESIFDTIAYCLMPNHFHFLIKVKSQEAIKDNISKNQDSNRIRAYCQDQASVLELIEDQYRRLFSSYALKYNRKYDSRGQLFLNKHKHIEVHEGKILDKLCYIHHNPIHHGFCYDYDQWDYSSYHSYCRETPSKIFKEFFDLSLDEFQKIHDVYKANFSKSKDFDD